MLLFFLIEVSIIPFDMPSIRRLIVSADNITLLNFLTSIGLSINGKISRHGFDKVSPIVYGFLACNQFSYMITTGAMVQWLERPHCSR